MYTCGFLWDDMYIVHNGRELLGRIPAAIAVDREYEATKDTFVFLTEAIQHLRNELHKKRAYILDDLEHLVHFETEVNTE